MVTPPHPTAQALRFAHAPVHHGRPAVPSTRGKELTRSRGARGELGAKPRFDAGRRKVIRTFPPALHPGRLAPRLRVSACACPHPHPPVASTPEAWQTLARGAKRPRVPRPSSTPTLARVAAAVFSAGEHGNLRHATIHPRNESAVAAHSCFPQFATESIPRTRDADSSSITRAPQWWHLRVSRTTSSVPPKPSLQWGHQC